MRAAHHDDATSGDEPPAAPRQADILSAVVFAAEQFLACPDWTAPIEAVLARLGHAARVSRVYIFQNRVDDDGQLVASQTHEWVAEGVAPQLDNTQLQTMPYAEEFARPLREALPHRRVFSGLVSDMPDAARDVLASQDIISIAIVPIFAGERWAGFLGFDDRQHPRCWTDAEIDALKAASATLGAAMLRTSAEHLLRQKEEQLRQAQKMQAVGTLAGGIAHDFNNVLQIICLCGESLRRAVEPASPQSRDIQTICDAVAQARALPNQLLAFSKKQVVQRRLFDLNALVSSLMLLLRRLLLEDVLLQQTLCASAPTVRADPGQLEQALINLIVNARDAMPRGGCMRVVTSTVELKQEQVCQHARVPAGHYAVLTVADDGHGMEDATRARVFEPLIVA